MVKITLVQSLAGTQVVYAGAEDAVAVKDYVYVCIDRQ